MLNFKRPMEKKETCHNLICTLKFNCFQFILRQTENPTEVCYCLYRKMG